MNPKRGSALLLRSLVLVLLAGGFVPSGAVAKETAKIVQSAESARSREYGEFLQEKFGVVFKPIVSKEDFLAAIEASTGTRVAALEPATVAGRTFDSMAALSIALKSANMKELAYTYPPEKVRKALTRAKVSASGLDAKSRQELAAAIDTGLLPPSLCAGFKPKAVPTKDLADSLLGGILSMRGVYKDYLGYVRDIDIYGKVRDAFQASVIIKAPELRSVVDSALKQKLITGYNLKDSRYDPHFINARTLTYGHSDVDHAIQLLGLLRSEGLDAKVQLEPKTSAFVYMKEWGDPGQPNENFEVLKIETGDYIEYAKEYDISFEFNTVRDKMRFQPLIFAYAKKDKKDQPGLLIKSWFQPLYHSRTELADYRLITNHFFGKGSYYAQTFSLNEQSEGIDKGFKSIDPSLDIKAYQFWVDEPFYRYLHGEGN